MRQIKKFEPLSVMRIAAICYGLLGVVEGALLALMFSVMPLTAANVPHLPRFFGLLFGTGAIVVFPVLFALMGAIGGGLGAVIYNISAKYVGGIVVEVE
ncbi:MAG: hypothetical protein WBS18_02900 [Candidatus Acidiferrales bacterium]